MIPLFSNNLNRPHDGRNGDAMLEKPEIKSLYELISRDCPSMPILQRKHLASKEVTEAHRAMVNKLLPFLKGIEYSGTIEVDTLIVLHEKIGKYCLQDRFRIRSADIYLPDLNILIEIDGRTHDYSISKISSDEVREDFYVSLGLFPPFRIDNSDVFIQSRVVRNCKEIMRFIEQQHERILTHPEEFIRSKKLVEINRRAFYRQYPSLKSLFPSIASGIVKERWVKKNMGLVYKMSAGGRSSVRGRPMKIGFDLLKEKIEELLRKSPQLTKPQIAAHLGYSLRQYNRIIKKLY